jgi:hypothetical protein
MSRTVKEKKTSQVCPIPKLSKYRRQKRNSRHNKLKLGSKSGICNGHLNLDTRFDGDRGNLLNNIWGTVEVNDSLVHPEFKSVPGVGT